MSILSLKKITWCGLARDKEKTLEALQAMDCLHVIPVARETTLREIAGPTQQTRDAFRFLQDAPSKGPQIHAPKQFDAVAIEKKALELLDAMNRLKEEKGFFRSHCRAPSMGVVHLFAS